MRLQERSVHMFLPECTRMLRRAQHLVEGQRPTIYIKSKSEWAITQAYQILFYLLLLKDNILSLVREYLHGDKMSALSLFIIILEMVIHALIFLCQDVVKIFSTCTEQFFQSLLACNLSKITHAYWFFKEAGLSWILSLKLSESDSWIVKANSMLQPLLLKDYTYDWAVIKTASILGAQCVQL